MSCRDDRAHHTVTITFNGLATYTMTSCSACHVRSWSVDGNPASLAKVLANVRQEPPPPRQMRAPAT